MPIRTMGSTRAKTRLEFLMADHLSELPLACLYSSAAGLITLALEAVNVFLRVSHEASSINTWDGWQFRRQHLR